MKKNIQKFLGKNSLQISIFTEMLILKDFRPREIIINILHLPLVSPPILAFFVGGPSTIESELAIFLITFVSFVYSAVSPVCSESQYILYR